MVHILFSRLVVSLLACMLFLTGCGQEPEESPVGATAAPSPSAPPVVTAAPAGPAFLTAAFAEDHQPQEYIEFQEESTGHEVQIVIATDRQVTDFQFLALTPREEEGDLTWDTETLYSLDVFSPHTPLLVTTTFAGDLPGRGIAYTDTDGSVRHYTLSLSGKDGSLLLEEFTPSPQTE